MLAGLAISYWMGQNEHYTKGIKDPELPTASQTNNNARNPNPRRVFGGSRNLNITISLGWKLLRWFAVSEIQKLKYCYYH